MKYIHRLFQLQLVSHKFYQVKIAWCHPSWTLLIYFGTIYIYSMCNLLEYYWSICIFK